MELRAYMQRFCACSGVLLLREVPIHFVFQMELNWCGLVLVIIFRRVICDNKTDFLFISNIFNCLDR